MEKTIREVDYDHLGSVQASSMSVVEGMDYLLTACESTLPTHDWTALRQLPYEEDMIHLRAWLTDVLTSEPPSLEIQAFFFGLYEPYLDDGLPTCQLYVSGSTRYDADDRSGSWAAWADDSYIPQKRYADSSVLTQTYRITHHTDPYLDADAEFLLNLGYAILVVKDFCTSLSPDLFLGQASQRAVAMGYDSGDLIPIGMITRQGFQIKIWT